MLDNIECGKNPTPRYDLSSRLTVVSHDAEKQHACASSGLHDRYSQSVFKLIRSSQVSQFSKRCGHSHIKEG